MSTRVRKIRHDQFPAAHLEREHVGEAPFGDEPAFRKDCHAAAQRFRIAQNVRAEEDGAASIAQPENQRSQVATAERIQPRHRLVEDHQFGIVDERLGDADTLQHALRELSQLQASLGADADVVQQTVDAGLPVGGAISEECGEIGQQFFGRQVIVEIGVLGQVADATLHAHVAGGPAEELGPTRRRIHELHEQFQRGGLAGAVRSEESEDLPRFNGESQPIERAVWPFAPEANGIIFRQLVGGQGRHGLAALLRFGALQLIRDRLIKELRRDGAVELDSVDEKRRR